MLIEWALLLGSLVLLPGETRAGETTGGNVAPKTPYERRALMMREFTKYIEWPQNALPEGAPFVIGILGEDPFGKDINVIKGMPIKDRKVVIRYYETAQEVKGCQVLFISASEAKRLPEIMQALEGSSTLTIGELEGFTEQNGMINFVPEHKRAGVETGMDFEINRAAAERANLQMRTQLLKLDKRIMKSQKP